MLRIVIDGTEFYNEETETFETVGDIVLELEHSLVSLSKWESKYQKPFLSTIDKTPEELIDYVRFMILNESEVAGKELKLSSSNLDSIQEYIDSPESATTFGQMPETRGRGETITSELIYFWLVNYTIPFEVEKWHLNRLFSLVRVCNVKNTKPTKMSAKAIADRNRQINEARKRELGTSG